MPIVSEPIARTAMLGESQSRWDKFHLNFNYHAALLLDCSGFESDQISGEVPNRS